MRKLCLILMASSALAACGGDETEGAAGDAVLGAATFASNCSSCHAYEGEGSFKVIKVGNVGGESVVMDDLLSKYGTEEGLANYISSSMPYLNEDSCVGSCASDTAAYMASKLEDITEAAGPVASSCNLSDPVTYGVRKLQSLTSSEYRGSVVSAGLISSSEAAKINLPGDVVRTHSDYAVHGALKVEATRAAAFDKAAARIAELATPDLVRQCGDDRNRCTDTFLDVAYLLHRKPLDNDEKDLYRDLFSEFGATSGMQTAIAVALTSPQFLYRSEMGVRVSEARSSGDFKAGNLDEADRDAYILTAYELASQLAYMYTGAGPSKALLDLADRGRLSSDAEVEDAIDDLVDSRAGRAHVEEFGRTWFRAKDVVDESRPSFNDFNAEVAEDMATEVSKLFAEVWYNDRYDLEDLYAGDFTVVNSRLADFYGHDNFNGGVNDWRVTEIANRGGMVTTGAFHAAHSNDLHTRPVLKAVDLRELMLCHHVGAPQNGLASAAEIAENQDNIVSTLRDKGGDASAREYYEASTGAAGCQVCHATVINPLMGIDDFDQVGRYRTSQTGLKLVTDAGLFDAGNRGVDVDDAGQLIGLANLNDGDVINYRGAKDLGEKMASLPAVAACMVVNSFRYTTGLAIDRDSVAKNGTATIREDTLSDEQVEDYACAKEVLLDTYNNSGKKPLDVYRKIGTLDLIRFRK